MRVKTDKKRDEILSVAARIFNKNGYARTSMSAISKEVGGSKETLYNYFSSKEDLFAEVMITVMESQASKLKKTIDNLDGDLKETLEEFAIAFLELKTSPKLISFIRAGIAEAGHSNLGQKLYEVGPKQGCEHICRFITHQVEQGKLRNEDPWIITLHLKALIESGSSEALLFGNDELEIDNETSAKKAIEAFLRAYAI